MDATKPQALELEISVDPSKARQLLEAVTTAIKALQGVADALTVTARG